LRQSETVQSSLFFKPIEFDRFKIGVINVFPDAQKLDCIPAPEPVVDNALIPKGFDHIRERNTITVPVPDHGDR